MIFNKLRRLYANVIFKVLNKTIKQEHLKIQPLVMNELFQRPTRCLGDFIAQVPRALDLSVVTLQKREIYRGLCMDISRRMHSRS